MEIRTFELPIFTQSMERKIYVITEFEKDLFSVFYEEEKIGELQVAKTGQILHWFVNSGEDRDLLLELADRILPAEVFDYCRKLRYYITNHAGLSVSDIQWQFIPSSRIEFIVILEAASDKGEVDHLKTIMLNFINHKKNDLPAGEFKYQILSSDSEVLSEAEYWNISED